MATGEVTIVAAGKATITATIADSHNYAYATKTSSYNITVTKRTQDISHSPVNATYGDTGLKVYARSDGDGALSYQVLSGNSVTVDENGNLTVLRAGNATVRVTAAETHVYAKGTVDVSVTIKKLTGYAATVTNVNRPYDGTEKPLITVDNSTLDGGTMQYALGTNATTVPTEGWSEDIPTATDIGRYFVWSKFVADENHTTPDPTVATSVTVPYYIERAYENSKVTQAKHDMPYSTTFLYADNIPYTLSEGWYVLTEDASCGNITVSGDVHLVLMDGTTLTVSGSITNNGKLNIYGQNEGNAKLNISGRDAENISGGTLVIHDCEISATETSNYAAISSEDVTIYAGSLSAIAQTGAGIGGGIMKGYNGTVRIYGGSVYTQNSTNPSTGFSVGEGIGAGASASGSGTLILGPGIGLVDGDGFTLVAPSDKEQTVTKRAQVMKTGIAAVLDPVSYRSASYNESTGKVEFTENTVSEYLFMTTSRTTWKNRWIVVDKDVTLTTSVTIEETANLIICDGATLTLDDSCIKLEDGDTLNIYGGAQGTGKLVINGTSYYAGIGCYHAYDVGGTLAIHGCDVTAKGEGYAGTPGIGVKNVTIYAGSVTATGFGGAGIGSKIGFDYNGTVRIYGGDVTAVSQKDDSDAHGSGIGAGARGNDRSTLILGAGIGLVNGKGKTIAEPKNEAQTVTVRKTTMKTGVGTSVAHDPVSYIEKGTEKTCEVYEFFDEDPIKLEDGWYVVSGTVTVSDRISISRDTSIILCDSAELICEKGIMLPKDITLTIYGQTEGTGKLIAESDEYGYAAIGADYGNGFGTFNVYGGQINAKSRSLAIGADNGSGTLYVAGGKLVLSNTMYSRALNVATVTMESGLKMYQSYEPDPEETGDEVNEWEIEHNGFSRNYVTIVSKSAGGLVPDPGMKFVPTVSRLTSDMVEDMESLVDDMPSDFTVIDMEIAQAWDGGGADDAYLIFSIDDGRYLRALHFEFGDNYGWRSFYDVDDLKSYMNDRTQIYYVTGTTQVPDTDDDGGWMVSMRNETITATWLSNETGPDLSKQHTLTITAKSGPVTGEPYEASYSTDTWTLDAPTFTYYCLEDQSDPDSGVKLDGAPRTKGIYCVKATVTFTNRGRSQDYSIKKTFAIGYDVLNITGATLKARDYEAGNTTAEVLSVTFDNANLVRNVDYKVTNVSVENRAGENVPVTVTVKILKGDYFLASSSYQATMTINKIAYTGLTEATYRIMSSEYSYMESNLPIDDSVISEIRITNNYSDYVTIENWGNSYFSAATMTQLDSTDPMPIILHVVSNAYEDFDFTINIVPTDKPIPFFYVNGVPGILTVGKTSDIPDVDKDGDGTLSYSVIPGYEEYIDIDPATGAVTAKKAGTAYFLATVSETDEYAETSRYKMITIVKAQDLEVDSDTDSDTDLDTDSEVDSDTDSEVDSDTDSEVDSDTDSEVDSDSDSEVDSDTDSEVDSDTDSEVDSDSDSESDSDTKTNYDVKVEGNTAKVENVNVKELLENNDNGVVTIDASNLSENITAIVLPNNLLNAISESGIRSLEIKLPTGSIVFDSTALAAIAAQMGTGNVTLSLNIIGIESLSDIQQDAIRNKNPEAIFKIDMIADSQPISSFEGGKATVAVPYEIPEGKNAEDIAVYYIAPDGTFTRMTARYTNGNVEFVTGHFSEYMVTFEHSDR